MLIMEKDYHLTYIRCHFCDETTLNGWGKLLYKFATLFEISGYPFYVYNTCNNNKKNK